MLSITKALLFIKLVKLNGWALEINLVKIIMDTSNILIVQVPLK